jgi:hypothetical protein
VYISTGLAQVNIARSGFCLNWQISEGSEIARKETRESTFRTSQ